MSFDLEILKHLQCFPDGYLELFENNTYTYYLGIQTEMFGHNLTIAVDIDETMSDFNIDIPLKMFNSKDKVIYLGNIESICSDFEDAQLIEQFKSKTDKKYGFLPIVAMLRYHKRTNAPLEQCIQKVYNPYVERIEQLAQDKDSPFSFM